MAAMRVQRISHPRELKGFSTGRDSVDIWFQNNAWKMDSEGRVNTWLCFEGGSLVGAFALRVIALHEIPEATHRVRRYFDGQSAGVLIAQMGVPQDLQGHGYGRRVLLSAMGKAVEVHAISSVRGVVLDAADDDLLGFYEKLRFGRTGFGRRLFMPMKNVIQVVENFS